MKKSAEITKMDYKIIISIEAEKDTNEAYCYYESRQSGLGDRFLNELSQFYKKVKEHPKYYSFTSEKKITRSVALKTFPYRIIYEIEGEELYVYTVYHFRKNPDELNKIS
jgi:mRNA-degrading endonuclease RelE of RelBE toxin-antitoxin system